MNVVGWLVGSNFICGVALRGLLLHNEVSLSLPTPTLS